MTSRFVFILKFALLALAVGCSGAQAQSGLLIVDEKTFMDVIYAPRTVELSPQQKLQVAMNLQNWRTYYRTDSLCAVVVGHSDASEASSKSELDELSQGRMTVVTDYLVHQGVPRSKIQAFSAGPEKPVYEPPSIKNLRTEIEVLPCP